MVELDELEELHQEDPEAIDVERDNDEHNGRISPTPQYPNHQDCDAEISFHLDPLCRAEDENAAVADLLAGDQFLGDF